MTGAAAQNGRGSTSVTGWGAPGHTTTNTQTARSASDARHTVTETPRFHARAAREMERVSAARSSASQSSARAILASRGRPIRVRLPARRATAKRACEIADTARAPFASRWDVIGGTLATAPTFRASSASRAR